MELKYLRNCRNNCLKDRVMAIFIRRLQAGVKWLMYNI
jgi:hypothetical protein